MTANSIESVSRRPDVLGIHSLDHLCVTVPDLAEAKAFYESFGLDAREEPDGLGLYTHGHDHRWALLVEGARKRLTYLSFGVFEDDLPRFREHLQAVGAEETGPPAGFDTNGLWLTDPSGTPVEIKVAEKSTPNAKPEYHKPSVPPGERGAPLRSEMPRTKPRRLSHVALYVDDVDKSFDFYCRVLGMRLSDRSADIVAFLHGVHGSDHHLLAMAKSTGRGIHHMSWDVRTVDDIGQGAAYMAERGYTRGWGVGRHVLGSNFFHYVRDPWGSYSEYSCDMDYVPADMDWRSGDFPPENSFYLWGPDVPEDFVVNYEAEA
jgi:catechol 2,3-dioxygenase